MRLCFFDDYRLGVVDNDAIRDVSEVLDEIAPQRYPFARDDAFIAHLPQLMPKIAAAAEGKPAIAPTRVRLRSPVPNPGKLIAAPVNYQAHLDEAIADPGTFARAHVRRIQETGLFLKATSALAGAGDGIVLSHPGRRSDHEIELAAVIGRRCKNVSKAEALSCVAGYCIGLDITIRGPEERSLRKSPDSYAVLGPWLVTADELGPPSGLQLSLSVNGEERQRANTDDLILGVGELIEFASSFYTLEPGDVVYTGTPEGVGPIRPGDVIVARIDRIGEMTLGVRE